MEGSRGGSRRADNRREEERRPSSSRRDNGDQRGEGRREVERSRERDRWDSREYTRHGDRQREEGSDERGRKDHGGDHRKDEKGHGDDKGSLPPPPPLPPKIEEDLPPLPAAPLPKEAPNMGLSGKLAAETNKVEGGIILKHQPPPDAAKPDRKWRMYVFKDGKMQEDPLHLHRLDHYLFGRDFHVADVVCAHPSISKQHAVLQFRKVAKVDEFGGQQVAVRPYLMDLGTVNGTFLNGERIDSERFYELLLKDSLKFGQSSREYLLLSEDAA